MQAMVVQPITARALTPADLPQVVAIDALIEGRSRRNYVERRLAAARRDPTLHAQFAVTDDRGLAGYIMARVLEGEFGGDERMLRLEMVGVRPDTQGHGVGRSLFDALAHWAQRHGIGELRTSARWNDAAMLRWLNAVGFVLAPSYIIDCAVDGGAYLAQRDAMHAKGALDGDRELDFSDAAGNDFERLARDSSEVHSMRVADLSDIVRIDRDITGRDRSAYMQAKLAEAIDDSSLRLSLAAQCDSVNVGYLMARVDRGDYGRTEPVAIIDTLGVAPDYARRGIGRALLSQLFVNLGALRVERVETLVDPRNQALLGFFFAVGFAPAQRLPFLRRL